MSIKKSSYRKGWAAEYLAAGFLMTKRYRILKHRYRVKAGEIDLIAQKGKRLSFIEVKARKTLEQALVALTAHQEKRIISASEYWISNKPYYQSHDISYDYIIFLPWRIPVHYEGYFR